MNNLEMWLINNPSVPFYRIVNISGEYNSLLEIEAADTVFNYIGINSLLYAAFSMIFCVMSKPLWFPQN